MSFISYAQNYEDVVLWRALKHIEKGFYIDVGAMDPTVDSVTKAFYDAEWRGINIESAQEWYARLVTERPGDTNLQLVCGDKEGSVKFYEVAGTGLSTIHEDLALRAASECGFTVKQGSVTMRTLNSICEEHQLQEIHFLKVDAEGAEKSVLQGLDLQKYRPWIILVEATSPGSQNENYLQWEPLLKNNGYLFAYFDGLNRFYVAGEHSTLAEPLSVPPNIFDGFIRWKDLQISEELVNLKSQVESIQSSRDRTQAELDAVQSDRNRVETELNTALTDRDRTQAELDAVQSDRNRVETELNTALTDRDRIWHELDSIFHSKSYRITKPFREIARFLRKSAAALKNLFIKPKALAFAIIHFIRMLPLISSLADVIKRTFPGLWAKSRKKLLRVPKNINGQSIQLSSAMLVEDEQYFQNLFQNEIANRKRASRGQS